MHRPQKPDGIDAPGLTCRQRSGSRMAMYWQCRSDLRKRGFPIATRRLWPLSNSGAEPTADDWNAIASQCATLQAEMLEWANGGPATSVAPFDDTVRSLIRIYQSDPDSPFRNQRFHTRKTVAGNLAVLERAIGDFRISGLTFRDVKRWHETFATDGRTSYAYVLMATIRQAFSFGKLLRLPGCADVKEMLSEMRFTNPRRRRTFMTWQQATAIRQEAHRQGFPSIALAQAAQFELMLRQRDVIGEWIPRAEPGLSDIVEGGWKWLHGLRWEEMTGGLLEHRISKSLRGRNATMSPDAGNVEPYRLASYPMLVEELHLMGEGVKRGPLVVCEDTGKPWKASTFRHRWRLIARAAGVPDEVENRDSRAGAITEGVEADQPLERLRKHAGHSDLSMTARYDRGSTESKDKVAEARARKRNTPG